MVGANNADVYQELHHCIVGNFFFLTFMVDQHFTQFGFGQKEGFCRGGICFGRPRGRGLCLGVKKRSKMEGQLGLRVRDTFKTVSEC